MCNTVKCGDHQYYYNTFDSPFHELTKSSEPIKYKCSCLTKESIEEKSRNLIKINEALF